jgi:hypothetical protein
MHTKKTSPLIILRLLRLSTLNLVILFETDFRKKIHFVDMIILSILLSLGP